MMLSRSRDDNLFLMKRLVADSWLLNEIVAVESRMREIVFELFVIVSNAENFDDVLIDRRDFLRVLSLMNSNDLVRESRSDRKIEFFMIFS